MSGNLIVERIVKYDINDAIGIGKLMPFLSQRLSDKPMSTEILKAIIDSPNQVQIVASLDGEIVGTATLSLIFGPAVVKSAYLSDFVTNPNIRGKGVGGKIWDEMIAWCKEQDANLTFTSKAKREDAHRFYINHGAEVHETVVFKVNLRE